MPDPVPAAFDDGGETCLEATFPNSGTVRLGQFGYYKCNDDQGQQYSLGEKIKFALGANYSADENAYSELAAKVPR